MQYTRRRRRTEREKEVKISTYFTQSRSSSKMISKSVEWSPQSVCVFVRVLLLSNNEIDLIQN